MPALERFSAEKFRQWLADLVSLDDAPDESDIDAMKVAAITFLSLCPAVYGHTDRIKLWERIADGVRLGCDQCNDDLLEWANIVLTHINAEESRVVANADLCRSLESLESRPDWWRAECLRVVRKYRFSLLAAAREQHNLRKEANGHAK